MRSPFSSNDAVTVAACLCIPCSVYGHDFPFSHRKFRMRIPLSSFSFDHAWPPRLASNRPEQAAWRTHCARHHGRCRGRDLRRGHRNRRLATRRGRVAEAGQQPRVGRGRIAKHRRRSHRYSRHHKFYPRRRKSYLARGTAHSHNVAPGRRPSTRCLPESQLDLVYRGITTEYMDIKQWALAAGQRFSPGSSSWARP
jgi:hypothetical protein